jgi:E3 ubiquitin-protein transferase RMND5
LEFLTFKDVLKRIVNTNKTYYDHLSKYGKSIGKELISKPEYEEPLFKDFVIDKTILNQIIAEHMYRSGSYQAGETFSKEAKIEMLDDFKNKFKELNTIVKDLKEYKVESALLWARDHSKALDNINSDLLFNLH